MTQLLQNSSGQVAASSLSKPWGFLDLLMAPLNAELTLTAIAVALAWIPPALLSALRGGSAFLSFLTDYASQSRFLIILPVLILATPSLHQRVARVAHHLEKFVQESQLSTFKASWSSFERLRHSRLAQVVIVLLTYAFAIWLAQYGKPTRGRGC